MAPARHPGRRRPTPQRNISAAEREIRAAQQKRLEAEAALEAKVSELAHLIDHHMKDGVGTTEIGTWLVSPRKPKGVTRQQVYKLVAERVDHKDMRSPKPADSNGRPRPRPQRNPE